MGNSSFNSVLAVLLCAASLIVLGCASWKKDSQTPTKLPEIRSAPESVPVEILVLNVEKSEQALLYKMWDEIDPTRIDLETRRRQDENGMRSGIIQTRHSASLNRLIEIDRNRRQKEQVAAESLAAEKTIQKAMRVQTGRPFQVIVSKTYPVLSWVMNDNGYLIGKESPSAQCSIECVVRLSQDGSIKLEATPEIHFGNPKQRIDVGNNSLVYKTSRDKHSFENLRATAKMSPGETMVLSKNLQPSGLGIDFFNESDVNHSVSKVVLVRLGEMRMDNLFAPADKNASTVTPTD